jgi:hypothetical protein
VAWLLLGERTAMGKVTPLRGPSEPGSCVVGDHVYLYLSRAELVDVVQALHHSSGESALEHRLAELLRSMRTATSVRMAPRHADGVRLVR